MAGETVITIIGNLTADPELRYTQNGLPVANFTIASTPREYNRQTNDWKDGEALFLRASVWRDVAENVAASLTKGARVIATGRLKQRSYEDREGNKRTAYELEVDEIGPSLRYAQAAVQKIQRDGMTRQQPSSYQQDSADAWATPPGVPDQEPWATPQQQAQPTTNGSQPTFDEPWATPRGGSSNMTERGAGPAVPPVASDYGDDTPF